MWGIRNRQRAGRRGALTVFQRRAGALLGGRSVGHCIINVLGSFIIRLLRNTTGRTGGLPSARRAAIVMVGCGGFTRSPRSAWQTLNLMERREWLRAGGNGRCVGHVVPGLGLGGHALASVSRREIAASASCRVSSQPVAVAVGMGVVGASASKDRVAPARKHSAAGGLRAHDRARPDSRTPTSAW